MKIYPSITSLVPSWKSKLEEINQFGIKEACFFPTGMQEDERKEFYKIAGSFGLERIPFVHLRNDMALWELDFLAHNFGTEVFNVHSEKEFPFIYDYSKYKDRIFVENVYTINNEDEILAFGGLCLDMSHLENDRINLPEKYEKIIKMAERFKIGCNHISCVKGEAHFDERSQAMRIDEHWLKNLEEMDYLKKYPLSLFSDFVAIELDNPIKTQMEAKEYLERTILNFEIAGKI